MLEVGGGGVCVPAAPACGKPERGVALTVSCSASATPGTFLRLDLAQPRTRSVPVPHFAQSHDWDCGLACAAMVLMATDAGWRQPADGLQALCGTKSIWTVDLAHLLARHGLRVVFCTLRAGVHPDYAREAFYKPTLAQDRARVARLFAEAERLGIDVQSRSVPTAELQRALLGGTCLVIVLVDKPRLARARGLPGGLPLGEQRAALREQRLWGHDRQRPYTGHYLVLCGYDEMTASFLVHDPASTTGQYEQVPHEALACARQAFGTDEDMLLVTLPQALTAP